ncbi:uncharacterized protein [Hetaerina americana]|uniref:uncharacterized protein n=1 Tax=Hetaerina americana TaxID=62018 RepID=UPI003A7F1EB7
MDPFTLNDFYCDCLCLDTDSIAFAIVAVSSATLASPGSNYWGLTGHGYGGQYAYPNYSFDYGVHSPHTGDVKNHQESRIGDLVKGSYSLNDPDGTIRQVDYVADKHNGFNAVVKKIGHAVHPPTVSHHQYQYGSYGAHFGEGLFGGGAHAVGGLGLHGGLGGGESYAYVSKDVGQLGGGLYDGGHFGGATSYANGNNLSFGTYGVITLLAVAAASCTLAFPGDHFSGAPGHHFSGAPGQQFDGPPAYPKYNYGYDVDSPHTGDVKNQWEERNGDVVKGSYRLSEPDGTIRQVDYTADGHNGFNAVVKKLGKASHPTVAHSPAYYGGNQYGPGHPGGASSYASVNNDAGHYGGPHHGSRLYGNSNFGFGQIGGGHLGGGHLGGGHLGGGHLGGGHLGGGHLGGGLLGGATSYANGNLHSVGNYGGGAGAYGGSNVYGSHLGGGYGGPYGGYGATSHANGNNLAFSHHNHGGGPHGGYGNHGNNW